MDQLLYLKILNFPKKKKREDFVFYSFMKTRSCLLSGVAAFKNTFIENPK